MNEEERSWQRLAQALRKSDGLGVLFEGCGATLRRVPFRSRRGDCLLGHDAYRCELHGLDFPGEASSDSPPDAAVHENTDFHVPVLHTSGGAPARQLVVVLNGLNERSYARYLPWAWNVWKDTGAAVALFPLSFHVNRVHPSWARGLDGFLSRRRELVGNENAHLYNCVLSDRLGLHPERLFWGAVQSFGDVVDLVHDVRAGRVEGVAADARVDFLGFSAGGYIALGLLLADETGLFADSRALLFESGAAMRANHLSTRLIMDLSCEVALLKLYVRFTARLANPRLAHWLAEHPEGRWFRALFGDERERERLEARLRVLAPRLLAIANSNDQVIPAGMIFNTLGGRHRDTGVRIEELALGVHEHPFVCADYEQRDRRFVVETLDEARFGEAFTRFSALAAAFLR
ncbi:MAG: DUF6051 family protein [Myxococcota bacterium]